MRPVLTHPHGAGVHGHCLETFTFPFKGIECRVGIQGSPEILSKLFPAVLLHLYLSTGLSWGSAETAVEIEDKTPSLRMGQVQGWHLCVATHWPHVPSYPTFLIPCSAISILSLLAGDLLWAFLKAPCVIFKCE